MPLTPGTGAGVPSGKSLIVGTLSIKNAHKPSHQPELMNVIVKEGGKNHSFTLPELLSDQGSNGRKYAFSMDVASGTVTLEGMNFVRQIPGLLFATAGLKLENTLNVPDNSVIYIGHVTATIIPKKDTGLPAAGPVVPLVDQALTGFFTGAFQVTIADESNKDMAALKSKYPELRKMKFVKSILPAYKPK